MQTVRESAGLLSRGARMKGLLEELYPLERDLVSDGFDQALERLGGELPVQVHRYRSGAEAWSWIIPEKWSCQEAYLERMNGERILDQRNHPLHCARYSAPFEGVVSREELLKHLESTDRRPLDIPYAWRHYRKDWALCAPAAVRAALGDDSYRVVIRTRHEPGWLKVGEVVAPGAGEGEFVLCAHLDHPAMANDDLAGVLVGVEVMRQILQWPDRRCTYRLLITPETIGSVAWLSEHEERIPRIQAGLFLEMLGTPCPHALQHSYRGDTEADRLFALALKELDPEGWSGPYRRVIGNDERQFNAPGVRIPMLSLARIFHPRTGRWPYPEYHTSADTPAVVSPESLEGSVELVLQMLRWWERNQYPVNRFRGEPFMTRYGLFVDFYQDREGNLRLFDVLQRIDGTNSVAQIASACGASFSYVLETVERLQRLGLVRMSPVPVSSESR